MHPNIIITYLTLRKVIGWLGILLVPVLILGKFLLDHNTEIEISASAYYYTSMRNELVGIICGIALFLLAYHGYSWQDSLVSKLSGLFALGIAFFPTAPGPDKSDVSSVLHYVMSGLFFAALSYMSIFLFTKSTAPQMTPQKIKRNRVYRACGIIMVVSVIGIPIDGIAVIHARISFLHPTLILEAIALSSFGLSWLTKGEFILKDKPAAFSAVPPPVRSLSGRG